MSRYALTLRERQPLTSATVSRATDNSPAWWWHAILFNAGSIEPDELPALVERTPCHMFNTAQIQTANRARWHVGHLLQVRDHDTEWQRWPRTGAVWRFVRNIHPCNAYYLPLTNWQRVRRDPQLVASVAAYYRERYASIWDEFTGLVRAPAGYGGAAPDGPLVI